MKSFRNIISSIFYFGFFLLPSLSVVTCFVISPISGAPTTSPTSVCQSSQQSEQTTMKWFQHELSITAPSRGCHLITSNVQKVISNDLSQIKVGMCNLFVQHTSASLTINENADPDVRRDLEVALNKIVPASWNHDGTFKHTMEGDDDMPVRYCYLELCMCVVFCKSFLRSLLFCFLFRLHFLVIIRDT